MSVTTYWDVPEHERGDLTEAAVQDYAAVQLMLDGIIVPPEPPPLPDQPQADLESITVWQVGKPERYSTIKPIIAFASESDARTVAAMRIVEIDTDYGCGADFRHAVPVNANTVQPVEVLTLESIARNRDALVKYQEQKVSRGKLVDERIKAVKAAQSAVAAIWEDWHDRSRMIDKLAALGRTFHEYIDMTGGDRAMAFRFLCKAAGVEIATAAAKRAGYQPDAPADEPQPCNAVEAIAGELSRIAAAADGPL